MAVDSWPLRYAHMNDLTVASRPPSKGTTRSATIRFTWRSSLPAAQPLHLRGHQIDIFFAPIVNGRVRNACQTSPTAVRSSACFSTNAIYASENVEAFIEFSSSSFPQGS
ncbi:hypothetical protein AJ87_10640 [Rhizobium yanglingense]|nr:hypothetical protein AJ87_10640 [Rhizobium yanglingense]